MNCVKRTSSFILAIVLMMTTIFSGTILTNDDVYAAQVADSIKMPIVIYDHLADGLLFEYNLYNLKSNELSLEGESMAEITGAKENGQGLIENELGANGTPIYKKEVVEKVAELVKDYMQEEEDIDFDLYKQLVRQIVKEEGCEKTILGPEIYSLGVNQLGWRFKNTEYFTENDVDYWKDEDGNIKWHREGDWFYTSGGTDNKAVFDFGTLEAGEYELTFYDAQNVDITISYEKNDVNVEVSGTKFTIDKDANVILNLASKDDNEGSFTAPNLLDKDGKFVFENFTKPQNMKIAKLGWKFDSDSSWTNSQWGGITCEHGENSEIYYVFDVTEGRTYGLQYLNENELLDLKVTDMQGNVISDDVSKFTVPKDVDKVKIVLSCICDEEETAVIRFDNLVLKTFADVELGNYENSKRKFDSMAEFENITNCMDYAYYILNTFWTDTQGDVTEKTNLYKTITLNLRDEYYNFTSSNKVNYDIEKGNIYEEETEEIQDGFYPLDTDILGDKSDLTSPFGSGSDIYNVYDGQNHNYHFSMKVHCEFLYEADKNLQFKFNGDDDVYLFIDNKLVLDIGGAHLKKDGNVDINEIAERLGLENGKIYAFDFFYIERHTTASNLAIETNMIFEQADAKPSIVYKDEKGQSIEDETKVPVSEEVGIEYSVKAGNDGMSNVTFRDNKLDVVIGKAGIDLGKNNVFVKDKLTVTTYDIDGNLKEQYFINVKDLSNNEKVDEFTTKVGKMVINAKEIMTVSGLYREAGYDGMNSELDVDITAPMHKYSDDGKIKLVDEKIAVIPVGACINTVEKKFQYTVKYVDKDTGKEITDKKTSNGDYKKEIIEKAINIKDYTLCDDENKTITIGKKENEIIFYYSKNEIIESKDEEIEKCADKVIISKAGNDNRMLKNNADSKQADEEDNENILAPKTGYHNLGRRMYIILVISAAGVVLSARKIKAKK